MRAGIALLAVLFAAGCEDIPNTEPVTPDSMFRVESKPVGDPSMDPYSPEVVRPLINVPTDEPGRPARAAPPQ